MSEPLVEDGEVESILDNGDFKEYEIRNSSEIMMRSDRASYWITFLDLTDTDNPLDHLDTDNLVESNEVNEVDKYIEIGGSYKENNSLYRKIEIRPADFSDVEKEVEEALQTITEWNYEEFELMRSSL